MLGLGLVQNHFMNNATTKLCDESDNNKNNENNKNSTKKDVINGTNNTTISITRTASTHHQLNPISAKQQTQHTTTERARTRWDDQPEEKMNGIVRHQLQLATHILRIMLKEDFLKRL